MLQRGINATDAENWACAATASHRRRVHDRDPVRRGVIRFAGRGLASSPARSAPGPAEIFESGLENPGDIVAVAATVLWRDGRVTAGWFNMDPAVLARMILVLDEEQRRKTLRNVTG